MKKTSTIGLDLAKKVFQVHGVDEAGEVTIRRSLRRSQVLIYFGKLAPCLSDGGVCERALLARELSRLGHTVRLIAPAYAKGMCVGTRTMRRTRRRSARR